MKTARYNLLLLIIPLLVMAGCRVHLASNNGYGTTQATPAGSTHEVIVFAASSLNEAFNHLGIEFESNTENVKVRLNLAGSQELRTQIELGSPVDVFASANPRHVERLYQQGLVREGQAFARNDLVIIVPAGNPGNVRQVADLATVNRLVIAAPEVPVGQYTSDMMDKAAEVYGVDFPRRVRQRVVSEELNVRQVLHKVRLGEADAGIVYRTDAAVAGADVEMIEIPKELNVLVTYIIAVATHAPAGHLADQWVEWVLSPRGQSLLSQFGFSPIPLELDPPREVGDF